MCSHARLQTSKWEQPTIADGICRILNTEFFSMNLFNLLIIINTFSCHSCCCCAQLFGHFDVGFNGFNQTQHGTSDHCFTCKTMCFSTHTHTNGHVLIYEYIMSFTTLLLSGQCQSTLMTFCNSILSFSWPNGGLGQHLSLRNNSFLNWRMRNE